MKSRIFEAIGALALVSTISACATFEQAAATEPEYQRLAQVHPGLTKDDVLRIAGKPVMRTGSQARGEELWVYSTRNEWGADTDYDITFNGAGVVTDKTALPQGEG